MFEPPASPKAAGDAVSVRYLGPWAPSHARNFASWSLSAPLLVVLSTMSGLNRSGGLEHADEAAPTTVEQPV